MAATLPPRSAHTLSEGAAPEDVAVLLARSVPRERGCSSRLRSHLWPRRSGGSCGQRHGRSVQAKQAPTRRHLRKRQSSCLEASSLNRSSGGAASIWCWLTCWLPLKLTSTSASCRSSLERGDASSISLEGCSPPSQAKRTHPRRTSSTSARSSTRADAIPGGHLQRKSRRHSGAWGGI